LRTPSNHPITGTNGIATGRIAIGRFVRVRTSANAEDGIEFPETRRIRDVPSEERFSGLTILIPHGTGPTATQDPSWKLKPLTGLLEAKVLIERWRVEYNTIRPHSALGYRPPAPEAIQAWKSNLAKLGWTSKPETTEELT
jgi:transposase InsO family protein